MTKLYLRYSSRIKALLVGYLMLFITAMLHAEQTMSVQFTVQRYNLKTGEPSSYHKIWTDGPNIRVEEYDNTGTKISSVLLTDGTHNYMYTPRTKNATIFMNVGLVLEDFCKMATEGNMQASYGPLAKKVNDDSINGVVCRVYKIGGITAYYNTINGYCVKFKAGSSETRYLQIKVPADNAPALYRLPADARLKSIGFTPSIPNQ